MIESSLPFQPPIYLTTQGDPDRFFSDMARSTCRLSIAEYPIHITGALEAALAVLGPSEVKLATWWLSPNQAEDVIGLVRARRILSLELLIDNSSTAKVPDADKLIKRFIPNFTTYGKTHFKGMALRNRAGRHLSLITTQASPSLQAEWWFASNQPEMYSWFDAAFSGAQDPVQPDPALASRFKSATYTRRPGHQDVRASFVRRASHVPIPIHSIGMVGGPALPGLSLLASLASQMACPRVDVVTWMVSQRSLDGHRFLESIGLTGPTHFVVSEVMHGNFNKACVDYFVKMVPEWLRAYADNHAKMFLLTDDARQVAVFSTGNIQVEQPSAEIYWVTVDPVACEVVRSFAKRFLAK